MAKKATVQEFQQPPSTEIVIMAEALSVTESDELVQHEKTISRGLHTFTEVGEALQQIRDKRLYRTEFETFEGYCRLKWGMGRQYAYRLIGGAEVAGNLVSSIGDTALPAKEAHTRELAKLAPEAQPVAWLKAVQAAGSAEAVTAGHVSRAVDEVLGKAGRFEQKLWYAVDDKRREIYEPGEIQYGGGSGHPLNGHAWLLGSNLNRTKEYDGFQTVPIPKIDVPPITDKLPGLNPKPYESGTTVRYYPINHKKHIIYNDPVSYEERGQKRYPKCDYEDEGTIARKWGMLRERWFEYAIEPAQPSVDWTSGAYLQPDKFIRCYKCKTEHPHAEMVAGVHGEFWTCPEGHIIRDEQWAIRDVQSTPSAPLAPEPPPPPASVTPPAAPPANTMDDGDSDIDGDHMEELGEVYGALVDLDEFLETLRSNIDDFHELLNQRTELLEEFRANDEDIDDDTLFWARRLLTAMQEDDSDVSP